jgi:hypothetical protein
MTRVQQVGAVCGALLGAAAIGAAILRFFGTTVEPLPARFEQHVTVEQQWHASDSTADVAALDRDHELHGHIDRMEQEQGEMRRLVHVEQCMENSFAMLSAQKLVPFRCDSLGIPRRAGDVPPASLEPER